jgi:hypothetical protein
MTQLVKRAKRAPPLNKKNPTTSSIAAVILRAPLINDDYANAQIERPEK